VSKSWRTLGLLFSRAPIFLLELLFESCKLIGRLFSLNDPIDPPDEECMSTVSSSLEILCDGERFAERLKEIFCE